MANRDQVRERRKRAVALRAQGKSYDAIAEELGVSEATAWRDVERAYVDSIREPTEIVRSQEVARLDMLLEKCLEVLNRVHFAVANGRVVRRRVVDEHGLWIVIGGDDEHPIYEEEDVIDDAPTLNAIQTALKIQERRAKLLGLDAPTKVETWTVSAIDAKIMELEAELGRAIEDGEMTEA